MLGFYVGSWNLDSGLYVWAESALTYWSVFSAPSCSILMPPGSETVMVGGSEMRVGIRQLPLPQPPVCQPRVTEMGPSRARQRARYNPASSCSGEGCNVSMNFVLVNLYRKRDRPDSWRSCSQPGELIWKGGSEHTGVSESGGRGEAPTGPTYS